jgi:uncharacterized protein (DUF433 family)
LINQINKNLSHFVYDQLGCNLLGGYMSAVQKSLRIPQETVQEIEQLASESGSDFSSIAKDLLTEAIKMRHCPGIIFAEGVTGRRARVAGTGLEVWEVISTFKSASQNFKRLKKALHWLTEQQIRAAIGYYNAYRDEIDLQIKRNESWSKKELFERHPFLSKEQA